MKIENLDKAHAFWGVASNGRLKQSISTGAPFLLEHKVDAEWAATRCVDGKPVKVYVLVEDDA